MTVAAEKHSNAIYEAAVRLLSRAANARGLDADMINSRVRPAVEKYLLRDGGNVAAAEIGTFVDDIHADDLCLIVACEGNDEKAWEDLVAHYDSVVKSAARKI